MSMIATKISILADFQDLLSERDQELAWVIGKLQSNTTPCHNLHNKQIQWDDVLLQVDFELQKSIAKGRQCRSFEKNWLDRLVEKSRRRPFRELLERAEHFYRSKFQSMLKTARNVAQSRWTEASPAAMQYLFPQSQVAKSSNSRSITKRRRSSDSIATIESDEESNGNCASKSPNNMKVTIVLAGVKRRRSIVVPSCLNLHTKQPTKALNEESVEFIDMGCADLQDDLRLNSENHVSTEITGEAMIAKQATLEAKDLSIESETEERMPTESDGKLRTITYSPSLRFCPMHLSDGPALNTLNETFPSSAADKALIGKETTGGAKSSNCLASKRRSRELRSHFVQAQEPMLESNSSLTADDSSTTNETTQSSIGDVSNKRPRQLQRSKEPAGEQAHDSNSCSTRDDFNQPSSNYVSSLRVHQLMSSTMRREAHLLLHISQWKSWHLTNHTSSTMFIKTQEDVFNTFRDDEIHLSKLALKRASSYLDPQETSFCEAAKTYASLREETHKWWCSIAYKSCVEFATNSTRDWDCFEFSQRSLWDYILQLENDMCEYHCEELTSNEVARVDAARTIHSTPPLTSQTSLFQQSGRVHYLQNYVSCLRNYLSLSTSSRNKLFIRSYLARWKTDWANLSGPNDAKTSLLENETAQLDWFYREENALMSLSFRDPFVTGLGHAFGCSPFTMEINHYITIREKLWSFFCQSVLVESWKEWSKAVNPSFEKFEKSQLTLWGYFDAMENAMLKVHEARCSQIAGSWMVAPLMM